MARLTQVKCPAESESNNKDADSDTELSFAQTGLKIKDVMNPQVVTAAPVETIFTAARRMRSQNVSCAVVVDEGAVVGLFTQRDLLLGIAQEQEGYCQLPVAERMTSPVTVAPPDLPVLEASRILKSKRIKHLPIVAEGRLVGIVTQTDITCSLIYLTPLQRVSEVMSPHVATVNEETTVTDAARIMQSRRISCVVVMRFHQAVGVLSQRDILTRVILLHRNPVRTPVADVMSTPVLPIPPDYSVFTANRIMSRMRIHRLVVQDTKRIYGIVSQTDILHALERRLAEEEKHRLFLVCSDIPMFMLDAGGTLTYVNAAFLRLFEKGSPAQVLGTSLLDARFWSSPADRQRLQGMLDKGRSGMLGMVAMTGTGRLRRIVVLLTVTRNGRDEIGVWQGVAWRVTGRKSPKAALYHNAGDNTPGGILPTV